MDDEAAAKAAVLRFELVLNELQSRGYIPDPIKPADMNTTLLVAAILTLGMPKNEP